MHSYVIKQGESDKEPQINPGVTVQRRKQSHGTRGSTNGRLSSMKTGRYREWHLWWQEQHERRHRDEKVQLRVWICTKAFTKLG